MLVLQDALHEVGDDEGLRLRGGAPPGADEAAAGSKRDAFTLGLKVEVSNGRAYYILYINIINISNISYMSYIPVY